MVWELWIGKVGLSIDHGSSDEKHGLAVVVDRRQSQAAKWRPYVIDRPPHQPRARLRAPRHPLPCPHVLTSPAPPLLTSRSSGGSALATESSAELARALHRTAPRPTLPIAPPWAPLSPRPLHAVNRAPWGHIACSSTTETSPKRHRVGSCRG
jgi:hypothetical protein